MISILIVNYKTKNYLIELIPSIIDMIPEEKEIIIVDNDSGDNLDDLAILDSSVNIIYSKKNTGFGSGINTASKKAKGEWLFILNPDTIILDNPIPYLSKINSKIVLLGLNLVNQDDLIQAYQFGKFPTPISLMFNQSKSLWDSNPKNEVYPDWIGGGAFIIKKEVFDEIGGFDEAYFMYYEDIDLCRKIKDNNLQIMWIPNVRIWHKEGGAEHIKFKTKQRYYKSQRIYLSKFHSKLWIPLFFILHQVLLFKIYLDSKS